MLRGKMSSIDPLEVYMIYQSIKLHYSSEKHDAIKYRFRTSMSNSTFVKRGDRHFYEKLGQKYPKRADCIKYVVASFAQHMSTDLWIGDMINDFGDTYFAKWGEQAQNLTYNFKKDMSTIAKDGVFDDMITSIDGQIPKVISLYLGGSISFFSVLILDRITRFVSREHVKIDDTLMWPAIYLRLLKTRPFLNIEDDQLKPFIKIIKNSYEIA